MFSELTSQAETVFFGIMVGDLFGDVDPESENIDVHASVRNFAKLCETAIVEGFAKHGETVTVEWDSQNVGGSTPYGLKTRVNGEFDHDDVEFVDKITGEVWAEWNWIVYNS